MGNTGYLFSSMTLSIYQLNSHLKPNTTFGSFILNTDRMFEVATVVINDLLVHWIKTQPFDYLSFGQHLLLCQICLLNIVKRSRATDTLPVASCMKIVSPSSMKIVSPSSTCPMEKPLLEPRSEQGRLSRQWSRIISTLRLAPLMIYASLSPINLSHVVIIEGR